MISWYWLILAAFVGFCCGGYGPYVAWAFTVVEEQKTLRGVRKILSPDGSTYGARVREAKRFIDSKIVGDIFPSGED